MYIPLKVLQSKHCLQSDELSSHQSIAKTLHKYSINKKCKAKQNKNIEENTTSITITNNNKSHIINFNQLQKDIYQWFFSLDLNTRIKICSINNKWYINILHQLSYKYFSSPNCHFQMIDNDDLNEKENNLNFYSTLFKEYTTTFIAMSYTRKELETIDNNFYNQIRYVSLDNSLNDIVTLNKSFLDNKDTFMYYFSKLSSSNFALWIDVEYFEESKLYNFNKPKWVKDNQSLSLSSLVLYSFEQVIQINYQYYTYMKKVYEYPYYDELWNTNENLKQYLLSQDFKSMLNDINANDIVAMIKNDQMIKKAINIQGELNNRVMNSYKTNSHIGEKILEIRFIKNIIGQLAELDNVDELIDALTYVTFDSILKYAHIALWAIYRYIKTKYTDIIALDLLEEELKAMSTTTSNTKKKNKKKKKKKGNNQPSAIVENKDKEGLIAKEEGIAKEEKNEIITKEKTILSLDIEVKENDKSKDNIKEECNIESNGLVKNNSSSNISTIDDVNRKKRKKKGIYLYPTEKKIKQPKQQEPKSTNNNNQLKQNNIIKESKENNSITQSNISIIKPSTAQTNNNVIINDSIIYQQQYYNKNYSQSHCFPLYQPCLTNFSYCSNSMDVFYAILSYDITTFSSIVERNLSLLKEYKTKARDKLNDIIYTTLSPNYDIEIIYFGSYVTNLAIENSDIDIVIKYKSKTSKEDIKETSNTIDKIINELIIAFNSNKGLFEYINPIYSANVPIIKLRSDFSSEVNEKIKKTLIEGYHFDIDELFKTKFDITFNEVNEKGSSQEIVRYVNNALIDYPDIRPIMYVLKRFLQSGNLNSAYKGGLSSFSLFLLLLSYMKYPLNSFSENKSIGCTLSGFLCFYGAFAYDSYFIDSTKRIPFELIDLNNGFNNSKVAIIDPITKHNVAKMSFGILEVKKAFEQGHFYLNRYFNIPKQDGCPSSILKGLFNILKR